MSEAPDQRRRARHDALFTDHHDAVWRYAVRRVGDAAAEDVVAETFLVAWRRIDAVPDHELPWLFGVARKVIANQRRGQRRLAGLTARLAQEGDAARDEPPREPAVGADAVLTALATLGERDQKALRLVYWDALAPSDAARALGCSAVAMRVRLHRARARLARALAARGFPAAEDAATTHLTPTEA
jgi:RNA polymerase sigma-70 factor (ECF subfamily)